MDRVLVGLITCVREYLSSPPFYFLFLFLTHALRALDNAPDQVPTASDYLGTLLRDPTSSHLLETLVARSPPAVFALLYRTYFAGKLGRLAAHPVANFVVARAVRRADEKVLLEAVEELDGALGKVVSEYVSHDWEVAQVDHSISQRLREQVSCEHSLIELHPSSAARPTLLQYVDESAYIHTC